MSTPTDVPSTPNPQPVNGVSLTKYLLDKKYVHI